MGLWKQSVGRPIEIAAMNPGRIRLNNGLYIVREVGRLAQGYGPNRDEGEEEQKDSRFHILPFTVVSNESRHGADEYKRISGGMSKTYGTKKRRKVVKEKPAEGA